MTELQRGTVSRPPTHPGAILREDVLPEIGISKTAFAATIKVSRQMLYDILNETRPVTPAMALRLGKALGNDPNIWIGMQQKYDLFFQAQEMADELDDIQLISM